MKGKRLLKKLTYYNQEVGMKIIFKKVGFKYYDTAALSLKPKNHCMDITIYSINENGFEESTPLKVIIGDITSAEVEYLIHHLEDNEITAVQFILERSLNLN